MEYTKGKRTLPTRRTLTALAWGLGVGVALGRLYSSSPLSGHLRLVHIVGDKEYVDDVLDFLDDITSVPHVFDLSTQDVMRFVCLGSDVVDAPISPELIDLR